MSTFTDEGMAWVTAATDAVPFAGSPEFAHLNAAFAAAIARAQAKGLITPGHDPLALAVFIQAYTLGRVLGDLDTEPVDPVAWNALIGDVLDALVRPRR